MIPSNYIATKTPVQTLQSVYDAGKHKVAMSWDVLIIQSFMAGFYVGLGGQLALTVAGGMATIGKSDPGLQKLVFGALFPVALYPIVFTGAELFTGDAMILIIALLGGKITVRQVARNWVTAWIFNFLGCAFWAYLLGYQTGLFKLDPYKTYLFKVAEKKAGLEFVECFLRGIGANFSVCLAVWLSLTAADVPGKLSTMWWPIMAFAAIGFEHAIANMFVISLAMMYGAPITLTQFLRDSLLPSTLGNVVGGSLFMGLCYFWLFDHAKALTSVRHSSMYLSRAAHLHHQHHDDHHDDHPSDQPHDDQHLHDDHADHAEGTTKIVPLAALKRAL